MGDVQLLGPAEIRELAGAHNVRPTKTWGQNFVVDANTVRLIVRKAGVTADDHVIEVGPGLGSLTLALLEAARAVTVIEIDPGLAAALPATIARFAPSRAANLRVIHEDALQVTEIPEPETAPGLPPTVLVANLPYNVSVPVLLTILERFGSVQRGLVMVQAEVADRLAAPPGSKTYGVPSAKAAWYAKVDRAASIGRNVFWPAPNVDSALTAFERREPPSTRATRENTFRVIDAAFAQRRKTMRAALSGLAGGGVAAESALVAAGLDPRIRGEQLGIVQFAALAEALQDAGVLSAP
ncbi:16S rRNA (adenine(1518)-N(6)/adenine(1519)-N(6))-dimethyltransferase RsmA [Micrococcales bacterium 31B]|nr:16S rRNA (adenine(1518)-N(6)/adenine(1519)-N(6))-dimethyltransferase RsmA [Micrococcales bacterium 31B]